MSEGRCCIKGLPFPRVSGERGRESLVHSGWSKSPMGASMILPRTSCRRAHTERNGDDPPGLAHNDTAVASGGKGIPSPAGTSAVGLSMRVRSPGARSSEKSSLIQAVSVMVSASTASSVPEVLNPLVVMNAEVRKASVDASTPSRSRTSVAIPVVRSRLE